ncbi:MAG TPA: hypothetical protein VKT82_01880 [Ktedonobacterales bacterium]|nr:hypothetical protein [Ktedonobacterales bacterium]
MQDDQWNYPPKRGSNERPRPGGGNSGPLPGQRPGASRPANAAGPTSYGRSMGNPNNSSIGQSPMYNARDSRSLYDGGNQTQQRRGPSGPLNAGPPGGRNGTTGYSPASGGPTRNGASYGAGDSGRRSGALGGQGRTSGGWEEGQTWQGQGNTRTSRNLTPPTGRPALGGRGPSGQLGGNQRSWDDDEDEWDSRSMRSPSGKQAAGARPGQGGRPQQPLRKGTTMRGDWVVETDPKYRAPGTSLRVRLLFLLLAAFIALGAGVYFVPGAKSRVLSFLPGAKAPASTSGGTSGTLTLQVNAPSATVTLDTKSYTTKAGTTAPFSSVTIPSLAAGSHNITVHAANFTDFTGQLQMPGADTTMTAWLAPTPAQLTALGAQFKPATTPDPGVAGDHYNTTNMAVGKITVSISYVLTGLNPSPFTSQLAQSASTQNVPFKAATLALIPDITFTSAAGTKLSEYKPQALPTSQFGIQVPLTLGTKGAFQFGAATVVLPSNVTVSFTGPAKTDYALYYALASILPTTTNALSFKCAGAVDNQNFNPEDGLQITEAGGAHYFYRWGIMWATNAVAHALTPKAPMAQPNYNEFADANTAHANASCGS